MSAARRPSQVRMNATGRVGRDAQTRLVLATAKSTSSEVMGWRTKNIGGPISVGCDCARTGSQVRSKPPRSESHRFRKCRTIATSTSTLPAQPPHPSSLSTRVPPAPGVGRSPQRIHDAVPESFRDSSGADAPRAPLRRPSPPPARPSPPSSAPRSRAPHGQRRPRRGCAHACGHLCVVALCACAGRATPTAAGCAPRGRRYAIAL